MEKIVEFHDYCFHQKKQIKNYLQQNEMKE